MASVAWLGCIHRVCVLVTEIDLSVVSDIARGRLNSSAALHRRAVRPPRQRPLTQYQAYSSRTTSRDLMQVWVTVLGISAGYIYYFASAAVAVDYSRMTASSSASWSRFSPPSNFVNWHMSTMWFMVCRWPQSQQGDWARPSLCKLARYGP